MFWKHHVKCEIIGYSQNHIDVIFFDNNIAGWRLSCFYGYPERSRRSLSWDLIHFLAAISQLPWCIFGDFNDLLFDSDKDGKVPHPPNLMEGFRKVIDDSLFSEIDLCGGKFTWERGRETNDWVREKLDRVFATRSWLNKHPLCKISVHHVTRSDHDQIHWI